MPLAQITILEGRDPEAVARMAAAVTDAIAATLAAPHERIRVVVTELPADRWFVGGTSIAASRPDSTANHDNDDR